MQLSQPVRDSLLVTCIAICIHGAALVTLAVAVSGQNSSLWDVVFKQDAREYVTLTENLLRLQIFTLDGVTPEVFRTPGYSILMAPALLAGKGAYWSIAVAHTLFVGLLAGLTVVLAYAVGLARIPAFLAGLLVGVSSGPLLLTMTGMGSDIPFAFFYALAVYYVIRFKANGYTRSLILVGLGLGLSMLIRPIGTLMSIPILLGIAVLPGHYGAVRLIDHLKNVLIVLAVAAIVVGPWYVRNGVVADMAALSSLPPYNFVYYNMPAFLSYAHGTSEGQERGAILATLGNPELDTLRSFDYTASFKHMAGTFLYEHFLEYSAFHLYKMIPFFIGSGLNTIHATISAEVPAVRLSFFPTETVNLTSAALNGEWGQIIDHVRTYAVVTTERIIWLTAFVLVIISPFFAPARVRYILLFFVVIILTFAFLSSPVVQPRYRVPAEPFIWIAASYATHQLLLRTWQFARRNSSLTQ